MSEFADAVAEIDSAGKRADEAKRSALAILVALRVCRFCSPTVDASQSGYLAHWQSLLERALIALPKNDLAVRDEALARIALIHQADLAGDPGFADGDLDEDFAAAAFYALDVYAAANSESLHHAATRLVDAADRRADCDEESATFRSELALLRNLACLSLSTTDTESFISQGHTLIQNK